MAISVATKTLLSAVLIAVFGVGALPVGIASSRAVWAQPTQAPIATVPAPAAQPAPSLWEAVTPQVGDRAPIAGPGAPVLLSEAAPVGGDYRRLHVKFVAAQAPAWTADTLVDNPNAPGAAAVVAGRADLEVRPLFTRSRALLDADAARAEKLSGEPQADLTSWYLFISTTEEAGRALADQLSELPNVEMVQPEPTLVATAPAEEELQGYLDRAPTGINAEWAWGQPGGAGQNVRILVVDSGFETTHSDLDGASAAGVAIPHEAPWDPHHGRQVLGILVADDDDAGLKGIAHAAGLRTVNSGRSSGDVANAINLATAAGGPGDVLSVSQGICAVDGCANGVVLPLVYSSSARDALRLAAAQGIVTVISAGNGGVNLDSYSARLGADAPNTIVVGAGNPAPVASCSAEDGPARGRVSTSNFGQRVDLQGWGACVRTAGDDDGFKWWGFTSAATPVVSGAAALVSSIAEERLAIQLNGSQVRALLTDSGRGQVTTGTRGGSIGPAPDVRAAVGLLSSLPANDMFSGGREVQALPFRTVVDSRYAGVQPDEPSLACGAISHSLWYRITPSASIEVSIDTRGSDHDTILGLWAQNGSDLQRIGCSDDIGANNPRSELTAMLEQGTTYLVQVGGSGEAVGNLRLTINGAGHDGVGCDVNGDGFGDVVVGTPGEDVGKARNAGRAVVLYGKRNAKPKQIDAVTQNWPGLVGDSERGDRLGASVACGDFNGDGFDDVALGSPGEDIDGAADAGAVRVLYGTETGLSRSNAATFTQDTPGVANKVERDDAFGAALTTGDFNGDGFFDLAIGAPGEAVGKRASSGIVHVLFGSFDGISASNDQRFTGDAKGLPNSAERGDLFGAALVAGDFDFDGYDDLAVGAPGEDLSRVNASGAVYVIPGSTDGLVSRQGTSLNIGRLSGSAKPGSGDAMGTALSAGDIDADGRADLVVGIPGRTVGGDRNGGAVVAYTGTKSGLAPAAGIMIHQDLAGLKGSAQRGDAFGSALVLGDLNRDGFDDLSVGSPGEGGNGVANHGIVHTVFGTRDGLDLGSSITTSQDTRGVAGKAESGDRLGAALSAIDVDGDDHRDLIIGVPYEDVGSKRNAGAMLIVPGSANGLEHRDAFGFTQKRLKPGPNERGDRFGEVL